jgi:hypothetical protein
MRRRHILLTAVVAAGALAPSAHASWRRPVPGEVTRPFDYRRSAPFERGARRDAWLAADAGQTVKAACSGTVTFAGSSPTGNVVTVNCGSLVATHLGLSGVRAATGAQVRAGAAIGHAGASGVGLGARRATDRWGYVDPMRLIGPEDPDLGPVPTAARREVRRPRAARRPVAVRSPRPHPAAPPLVAWAGLALVAATLAGVTGGTVRRRWGPSTSPRRSTTSTPRRT